MTTNNQIQFTGQSNVFLSDPSWFSISDLLDLVKSGKFDEAANRVALSGTDMRTSDWVKIGKATVTITLESTDAITANQIAALQEKLQEVRAQAQLHENMILEKISKLQALTFDGVTV